MSMINLEPIIEIFIDEGFAVVSGIEERIEHREQNGRYSPEDLEEIRRSIHTMRVNSTMVLFDALAEVSKSMEKLLSYYYQHRQQEEEEFLNRMLKRTVRFYQAEVEKVAAGREPEGDGSDIWEEIRDYLDSRRSEGGQETDGWQEEDRIKQRYYIPGRVKDGDKE